MSNLTRFEFYNNFDIWYDLYQENIGDPNLFINMMMYINKNLLLYGIGYGCLYGNGNGYAYEDGIGDGFGYEYGYRTGYGYGFGYECGFGSGCDEDEEIIGVLFDLGNGSC